MNNGQVNGFQCGGGNSTITLRLTQGEVMCMTGWECSEVHHNNQFLTRGIISASGWGL